MNVPKMKFIHYKAVFYIDFPFNNEVTCLIQAQLRRFSKVIENAHELQILFLYLIARFLLEKIMKNWFLLILLSICSLSTAQVLISRCNICQKCTYCAGDILYDCNVDSIYSSIINRNPSIVRAFPVNISKKETALGAIYDFRFSNNQNVTYQIRSKQPTQTSASQQVTSTPKQQTLINQTSSNSGQISKETNQVGGSGSSQVLTASWKAVQNASNVILQYSIKHFYLSIASTVESVAQETGLNTYTAIVRSQGSRIKMNVYIDPEDLTLKVLSLVFLSGSLQDATKESSLSSSAIGVGDKGAIIAGTSTQKIEGITIRKGLSVSKTVQEELKYLVGIYKELATFQLDSYSTIDSVVYSLNFTSILDSDIRYTFRVMAMAPVKNSNLRVDTSNSYQIMDYQLVNTSSNASFIYLNTPQLLYSDSYAETVLNQMNKDVLAPLKLLNIKLTNISSSTPFYILNYEEESKFYRFLISYDVLVGKIRVIDETIVDKNMVLSSQSLSTQLNKGNDAQKSQGVSQNISFAVDSAISFDDLKMIPVKKVTVNTSITDNLPKAIIIAPLQPLTPQPVIPTPVPSVFPQPIIPQPSSVKLNYINFRTDAVFIKALAVINSISSLSTSNILQVSQQYPSSGNIVKYIITVNYNLPSGRTLQVNADYNTQASTVSFPKYTYTPQTILMKNMFENMSLSSISSNKVVMDIISSIFMDNPQYFSAAVSSVKQIYAYAPYFNITYENSVYGVIGFDCEYNYFNRQTKVVSYNIPQKPIGNVDVKSAAMGNQNSIKSNAQNIETVTKATDNTFPSQSSSSTAEKDVFCLISQGSRCQQCTFRFYIDSQTFRCKPVPDQCYIFDYFQLQCSKCFSGYSLSNGICRL